MAYIRAHETSQKRKGRVVKRYEVVWRDPVRDDFGLPVQENGKTKMRSRQESFGTREDAEARRDELNLARHTNTGTYALAQQRKAADLPFGHFARELFESMQGTVKPRTVTEAEAVYRRYVADSFGNRAVATITAADVRHFRAELLSPRPERSYDTRSGERRPALNDDGTPRTMTLSRSTVKKAWDVLRRVFDVAVVDGAIKANPALSVPLPRQAATARTDTERADFKALPLTPAQIAAVADYIANVQHQPVYALAVTFSAYTGLRAGELRGLEIGDLTLPKTPGAMGMVSVSRTKTRRGGRWETGTPKSVRSTRVVPIDGWLADDLRDYLVTHPRRLDPAAPLFPGRMTCAEAKTAGVKQGDRAVAPPSAEQIAQTYKWTDPINTDNVAARYYAPALAALGLPASRWHDLRHSFAVNSLSAGEHYMQVSKWLGHASFVTTLTVYADYISETEGGKQAPLSRPVAALGQIQERVVVNLK
ncbi:tyrosine-type recombinase/integrase [Gordonia sp. ABSL1-1]|uniref:tyrosine-type recombinase/integrase n=1 Tax=Gordonia sp. ABSL1-1 TaxID=3053923 RepID=UPI002573E756|nr:tyrosine-type recombinase/integrase [Gordonia sp. ABSL1-1]MDL9935480.1 tyrosine-type recombinase/integrase [Gordonia sp. ABSL1-1]